MGPTRGSWRSGRSRSRRRFAKRGKGQTEIVRLDDRDLAEDPARLEVELSTAPMFATQSVIRVTAGAAPRCAGAEGAARHAVRQCADRRGGQSQTGLRLAQIVRDAQERRGAAVLQRRALALGVIDAELAEAGLSIDRETRDYLMTRLGADQALVALRGRQACALRARQRAHRARRHRGDRRRCGRDGARKFRLCGERRRGQGGAHRVAAPRGCGHRPLVGAVGAWPALHPAASRRFGARLWRQPGAGRQVAPAASAFQARARVPRPLQALGRDAGSRMRCR